MGQMRKFCLVITLSLLFFINLGCQSSYHEATPEELLFLAQISHSLNNVQLASIYPDAHQLNALHQPILPPLPPAPAALPPVQRQTQQHNKDDLPLDLRKVKWLHTNVSSWKQTATLKVNVSGSRINLNYSKAKVWPAKKAVSVVVNANPWIFVQKNGVWYAATWEWLRPGQTTKSRRAVAGDHIKRSPLKNFKPVAGVTYGFMVSGLARDGTRNVKERSEIVMYQWPGSSAKKAKPKRVGKAVKLLGRGV